VSKYEKPHYINNWENLSEYKANQNPSAAAYLEKKGMK
jgi:hypothetical protein